MKIKKILKIKIKNYDQLGSDRISNALGSLIYKNTLVIDFGTATTFDVISNNFEYLGGMIIPGPLTSFSSLLSNTSMIGKYKMHKLDFGVPHDFDEWSTCTSQEGCADPQKNSWVVSSVFTVVTDNFKNSSGPGMDYIKKRALPNSVVNELLAWKDDNQATGEDTAIYFLENYGEWKNWVPFDVQLDILNAL